MDGSNNNGNNAPTNRAGEPNQGMRKDLVYADRIRNRMQEEVRKLQLIDKLAVPYIGESEAQMKRLSDENSMLYRPGVSMLARTAAANGRSLENQEAEAIVQSITSNVRMEAGMTLSMAAILAIAVRRRYRSIPNAFLGTAGIKYSWPLFLTIGYSIPISLFLHPFCSQMIQSYQAYKFHQDPRTQNLRRREGATLTELEQLLRQQTAKLEQFTQEYSASLENTSNTSQWDQNQRKSEISALASAWSSGAEAKQPEQAPNAAWDSSSFDDDDASPIAASQRAEVTGSAGGSAWARVRQQSRQPVNYEGRQYSSPQSSSQRDGWGGSQEASSEFRGTAQRVGESSLSSSFGKDSSRDQAQRDFDRLLEQERKGLDQENKRWR